MPADHISKLLKIYDERKKAADYVPFQALPHLLCESLICIEDHRFYKHHGIDLIAILRANLTNILNLRFIEGGSTITQQLVRELVLNKNRTLRRKLLEIMIALNLEKRLSKQQIIELYLNICYFLSVDDKDANGLFNASEKIYGKNFNDLSLAETSFLAALVGAPLTNRSPASYVLKTVYRQHLILRHLLRNKKISRPDFEQAIKENIKIFDRSKETLPLHKIDECNPHYLMPFYVTKGMRQIFKNLKRSLRALYVVLRYHPIIFFICKKYGLPFYLIKAIIEKESSFNEKAFGTTNDKGLMQIIDPTFLYISKKYNKNWKPESVFNPLINIEAGSLYLKENLDLFTARVDPNYALHYALAAYNTGPDHVQQVIDLIAQHKLAKNWDNFKLYLPAVTGRWAPHTIKYVESIISSFHPVKYHVVF